MMQALSNLQYFTYLNKIIELFQIRSITSVDISEIVIAQMNAQYTKSHPGMTFLTMDLLDMSFEQESFTCFLDKGTLDALMSDGSKDSVERAEKLFKVCLASLLLKSLAS